MYTCGVLRPNKSNFLCIFCNYENPYGVIYGKHANKQATN